MLLIFAARATAPGKMLSEAASPGLVFSMCGSHLTD
jgi:hypothetical protein